MKTELTLNVLQTMSAQEYEDMTYQSVPVPNRIQRKVFIPDSSVQPGAGNGEPVTAEVLAQRQAEEAIRRETERRADEIVRKMAENKPDLPDGKTEQAVREIAGQERDRAAITEREAALPESVLRESQREREAVREVARENLLQERLQQMERDMVRDLQKEKTLGGD